MVDASAVIPVKQLANAKQRLAGLLNEAERRALFTAMVEDVLGAVSACDAVGEIMLVTDDVDMAALARDFGARTRPEPETPGLTQAVMASGRQLAEEGVDAMLFLPGDVPLVTPEELDIVMAAACLETPVFMIVPASDLGGSNCVLVSPPDCMTFGFGEDSFRRHLDIARELGLAPQVARLPGLGLDIDTPEDLRTLLLQSAERGGPECSTVRYLNTSGIAKRLDA